MFLRHASQLLPEYRASSPKDNNMFNFISFSARMLYNDVVSNEKAVSVE
jgi:hypothetical protein